MKTFMIVFGLYIMIMFIYVYRDDGSREHDRNTLLMGIAGVMVLLIYMSGLVLEPEIETESAKVIEIMEKSKKIEEQKELYVEGYLLERALWEDKKGNIYRNKKAVEVEIWSQKIITANGVEITQIYFLEGIFAGQWGYTLDKYLSIKQKKPL